MTSKEATVKALEALGEELDILGEAACKQAVHLENVDRHQEAQAISLDSINDSLQEIKSLLTLAIQEFRGNHYHLEGRVAILEDQTLVDRH